MKPELFIDILKKTYGHTRCIYLHVLGEPLLHPEIERLLEISRTFGFQVNLSSNGVLLASREDILLAAPALRQINISLHSYEQSGEQYLEKYLDDIFDFISKVHARRLPIWLNLRLWDIQETNIGAVSRRNTRILARLQLFFQLSEGFAAHLESGQSLTLAPGVFLSQEYQFSWPHNSRQVFGNTGSCRGLRDHIAILVDGTVIPCCLDAEADIPLGNIQQQSLAEILAKSRARLMQAGLLRRELVEPLCQRCNYRSRFK